MLDEIILEAKNIKPSWNFYVHDETWIMRIEATETGAIIKFNTEKFPESTPDDFAKAVCKVLSHAGYLDQFYKDKEC